MAPVNKTEVGIKTDFIKLQQLLKLSNIVSQGSDTKFIISNGDVTLDGETVLERGRKIRPGDELSVHFNGIQYHIHVFRKQEQ